MKLPKCVIFDFDGVIADTERSKFLHLKKLAKEHGVKLSPINIKDTVGNKTYDILSNNAKKFNPEKFEKIAIQRRVEHEKNILNLSPVSGVKELLGFLKKKKIRICLATSSERSVVEKFLGHNKILKYFDFLITATELPDSKRNPKFFSSVTERMMIAPEETVVIEDSPSGVSGAKKAGCVCFGLETYLSKKDLKTADKIFKSHAEIKKFFEKSSLL